MSTTASLIIRQRKNDKLYRVVIQVVHKRQNSSISTGVFVDQNNWDAARSMVKTSCKLYDNITQVNSILADKMKNTLDKIMELEKKGTLQSMDLKSVMNYLNPRKSNIKVVDALLEREKLLNGNGQTGLAKVCHNAIRLMHNTFNSDLVFEDLTNLKLEEIRLLYNSKNSKTGGNGFKTYLAQIKIAYKEALKLHKIMDNHELMSYQVKVKKTVKRAVGIDYIKKILNLKYKPGTYKYHCRNFLVFMYLQGGINLIDLLHLKPTNIIDGRLIYKRHKTSKIYDQPLAERSKEILNEYLAVKSSTGYIFPILKKHYEKEPEKTTYFYSRYQYVNQIIKEIGIEIGAPIKITSYVTRHSFASHARDAKVPITAIQGALMHESARTTERYLNEISVTISDQVFNTIEENLG